MKKVILTGIGAIALLAGLWSLDRDATPDLDPVVSGSIAKVEKPAGGRPFSVSNIETNAACLVSRGEKLTHRSSRFQASADCDQVWPGLARATTWIETGDGTTVLTDASGEAILTLSEGDGLAYEALDPPNALIAMSAAD